MNTIPSRASAIGNAVALREKAITGMQRVGATRSAGGDDAFEIEVALGCGRRADMDGTVREADMERIAVSIGIDRNGRDVHPTRRPDDAAGDLAAIGDQDALEHAQRPFTPADPDALSLRLTVPLS